VFKKRFHVAANLVALREKGVGEWGIANNISFIYIEEKIIMKKNYEYILILKPLYI